MMTSLNTAQLFVLIDAEARSSRIHLECHQRLTHYLEAWITQQKDPQKALAWIRGQPFELLWKTIPTTCLP